MVKRDFKISSLIVKEMLDDLSDCERIELNNWKSSHKDLYERLNKPENAKNHVAMLAEFPASDAWKQLDARIRRSAMRKYFAVAAAIILPLILLSGIFTLLVDKAECWEPVYAQVETLRGEEKMVLLPDGTQVHLNAMSRLVYPETFTGDQRRVELDGEAFFDVTKSDIPFVVSTPTMEIEVLGTVFNVSAYAGEPANAVLVEGSVRVSCVEESGCILTPGQMATVLEQTGDICVENVETDVHTSWRRGKIQFRDERLEDIMNELLRWYDFEVKYADDNLKNLRFGCSVNRFEEIGSFMELLKGTGKVSVKKENNHYLIINN